MKLAGAKDQERDHPLLLAALKELRALFETFEREGRYGEVQVGVMFSAGKPEVVRNLTNSTLKLVSR